MNRRVFVVACAWALQRERVVDTPGDNVQSEFSSVIDTVQFAVETRRQLRSRNSGLPAGRRMQFVSG